MTRAGCGAGRAPSLSQGTAVTHRRTVIDPLPQRRAASRRRRHAARAERWPKSSRSKDRSMRSVVSLEGNCTWLRAHRAAGHSLAADDDGAGAGEQQAGGSSGRGAQAGLEALVSAAASGRASEPGR